MGPPKITIKPERCPEAVIEWYKISGLEDRKQSSSRRDVALKAKQHLRALGWKFWYKDKKGRWELRYTSPSRGKDYISLRKACESCISDGGCDPQHVPLPLLNAHPPSSPSPSPPHAKKRPRKSNKNNPRSYKQVTASESTSEEESSSTVGDSEPSSSVDGKRGGRVLRIRSSTRNRPSSSVSLKDGRSLMECHSEAESSPQEEKVQNDSVCSVCLEGGDIIMCDRCPSSFHITCIGLDRVPDGDWFCPRCSCMICERPTCTEEYCAGGADNVDSNNNNITLVCAQCERRCHLGCLQTIGLSNMETRPNWFCAVGCGKVFFNLQKLVGKPIPVGAAGNLTWRLLKTGCSDDVEGFGQNESKLRVAFGLLHACFGQVIHGVSQRDMIRAAVFSLGSQHIRLNCRGFCTVILERNKEVISVATVRIHGQKVAEIAFVATREQFRRQGMCRVLMDELEKQLTSFGVESMVLHSTPSAIDTWTNSFAFVRMTRLDRSQYVDYTFLEFQDTTLCHKPLMKFPGVLLTT